MVEVGEEQAASMGLAAEDQKEEEEGHVRGFRHGGRRVGSVLHTGGGLDVRWRLVSDKGEGLGESVSV